MLKWINEFEGFEWDEGNLKHATRHGFSREEIEGALTGDFVEVIEVYQRSKEERYSIVARSPSGDLLSIVVTVRGSRLRVITAHRLKRQKRKAYEKDEA
jgi:uncharacterized DUF497 family protein